MPRLHSSLVLLGSIVALPGGAVAESPGKEGFAYFEKEVRPILVARCYDCHSEAAGKRKGGLWLDRKEGWAKGGDSGPVIVPGDVDKSLVVHALHYLDEDFQMPPKAKLDQSEIATLEKWIAMGAPDPRDASMAGAVREAAIDFEAARETWAYRPHQQPAVPAVQDIGWGHDPVDKFVLAKIEAQDLRPADRAEPRALVRRLYFDLIGLPPTPDEVAAFEAEPDNMAKVVDDLLARPAFGEKWGRHWLDVARYADSNGGDRNFTYFHAWRYRNYVIDAFNRDRSYYEFVRQQLAGDLMTAENDAERREQLIAASFLSIGPKMLTERDKEKLRLDTADEQVDTVGRAFLGLTMGCARCHDHKFDPISQEDYYAMAGIFRSTQVVQGTSTGCVNVASWVEQALPAEGDKDEEIAQKVERLELAMRLVVDKQFQKKAGGKKAPDKLPLGGVIYDDADAETVGEWKESSHFPNRFGKQYLHDDRSGKGEKSVTFRGSLPASGVYEVRVAYNHGPQRAKAVPVRVEAWEGVHEVVLDQTKRASVGGLFEPIGRFKFEKGGRVNVTIGNAGSEGFVIVDAVQFIAEGDIEQEAEAIAAMGGDDRSLFAMSEGDVKKEMNKLRKELRNEPLAMAPRDAEDAGDIHLRVRGEPDRLGAMVARDFPEVLHPGEAPAIAAGQSGRMELAEWITGDDNALLDRVLVNRVWHHLFGRGIVATVDNFGAIGAKPTHPELLDYLASEFRAGGGSVKSLVRRIVLSESYARGADAGAALLEADPENELFARQNRRRLSAEEIRDSVLHLAGRLKTEPGAGTAARFGGEDLDKPFDLKKETLRTVYLPVARNNTVPELALFDAANPDFVSGSRPTTTVPTQALFLLNGEFFQSQAAELAKMVYGSASDPREEIAGLYRRVLNRTPAEGELQRALEFVADLSGGSDSGEKLEKAYGHLAHMLLVSTEFLYLD